MLPFRFLRFLAACALIFSAATVLAQNIEATVPGETFQSIIQAASSARESGNTDEAIRDYSRAVTLRPDWAEGWWDIGTTQYQASRYTDAVASLRKLVAITPNMAPGWSMLGLSEFETQDYADSLAALQRARKLGGINDPDIARVADYHLALLLIRSGEFSSAASVLHTAFGSTPPAQVKQALGLVLLRIPLLPSEIDPSQDALVQAAADAAQDADPRKLAALVAKYPSTPWLHYAYGVALDKAGQPQNAIAQQKLETAITPASALPWIKISAIELHLREPKVALAAARRAVARDATSPEAHSALAADLRALGHTEQAGVEAREAARLPQIAHRGQRMIALYKIGSTGTPEGADAWNAAMQAYSAGNYPQVVAALKEWVVQNPSDGTAWAVMGLSEFDLKDYANARIHLQRGINIGLKGSAESIELARERLALLLIRDHQFDLASDLLSPTARRQPVSQQIQLALGLALLRIPLLPANLTPVQRSLALSAGAIVPLLLASRYAEAFPAFQKLIAAHPDMPWIHYAYGDALASLSQYDDAAAQMKMETNLSPHSALPWIRLAVIATERRRSADALRYAQTAVSLAPDSAEAHYQLGRAWLEDGDAQKSIAELMQANSLKPGNPEIHFQLARAYSKAGQPDKAATEQAAFLQLKALAAQGQSILSTDAH